MRRLILSAGFSLILGTVTPAQPPALERIPYNHPGLEVDLGVGLWAWPLPMDYDGDGDLDLVVSNPDKPNAATYVFENPGGPDPKHPVFRPAVRVGPSYDNIQVSYVDGQPRLLVPGKELVDFKQEGFKKSRPIYPKANIHDPGKKIRANQWKLVDHEADGDLDLLVAVGDWSDYGWDDAFDAQGHWTNGPLHGYVYLLRNDGSTAEPRYADPAKLEADGRPVDVFGRPSPNLADFDADGDLDLLCGEFLDGFTYFQNVGTREKPQYQAGRRLPAPEGQPLVMDLEMIVPVAIDWDADGDQDLIVGDEDGRVALVEHTGQVVDGLPRFLAPVYFRQQAADLKFGALSTPCAADWDADGDTDLVAGNSAGYLGWFENLGGAPPRWSAPRLFEIDGRPIRITAGPNGSIQGPAEAKWGYTVPDVADWDADGRPDLIVNSIWGKVVWYRNPGLPSPSPGGTGGLSTSALRPGGPDAAAASGSSSDRRHSQASGPTLPAADPLATTLEPARPIEVDWPGAPPKPAWTWWTPKPHTLATQWRTSARARDLTNDGLLDLVVLDPEGYLSLYERFRRPDGSLALHPPRRPFEADGPSAYDGGHVPRNRDPGPLHLNINRAGGSGRRQWCFADWDADGRLDLLVNSLNATWLRNTSDDPARFLSDDRGLVDTRILGGHATCPTVGDLDHDGRPDLIIGAEDGFLYRMPVPARP